MVAFLAPVVPIPCCRARFSRTLCTAILPTTRLSVAAVAKATVPIPPVVFVLGGPGSGKGTQCAKLKQDFDLAQVCVGDLLRREAASGTELGRKVAEIMQRGDIVPGHVTMGLLRAELTRLAGACEAVLIDGFPRAMDQAREFEDLVAKCCFVLFFQCEEQEMVRRILKRGETSGRADDNDEVVRKRLTTFLEKTMPVVDDYRNRGLVKEVDSGLGNPEEVYVHTKSIFQNVFTQ